MFRERQKLPQYFGAPVSHTEFQDKDGEVERVRVDDCSTLPPVGDYDLELNLRAGENLKEVSSVIINHGRVNMSVTKNPATPAKEGEPTNED